VVIHAWSAPRSLSTSLMYSFAQVRHPLLLLLCSVRASVHHAAGEGRSQTDGDPFQCTLARSAATRAFAAFRRGLVLGGSRYGRGPMRCDTVRVLITRKLLSSSVTLSAPCAHFFSSRALTLTWQLIFDFCFLYVWLQRDDMEVLDEPLYANFLRATGVDRPYRQELLSKMVRFGTMLNLQFEFPGTTACFN
jgi:hypothetical protein